MKGKANGWGIKEVQGNSDIETAIWASPQEEGDGKGACFGGGKIRESVPDLLTFGPRRVDEKNLWGEGSGEKTALMKE